MTQGPVSILHQQLKTKPRGGGATIQENHRILGGQQAESSQLKLEKSEVKGDIKGLTLSLSAWNNISKQPRQKSSRGEGHGGKKDISPGEKQLFKKGNSYE